MSSKETSRPTHCICTDAPATSLARIAPSTNSPASYQQITPLAPVSTQSFSSASRYVCTCALAHSHVTYTRDTFTRGHRALTCTCGLHNIVTAGDGGAADFGGNARLFPFFTFLSARLHVEASRI